MLQHRLADALRDAAVDLPIDDHRIDDGADVVDRPETDQLDLAGIRIDLDLADVGAVAEGEIRRIVDRGVLQTRLGIGREVVGGVGGLRHVREGDAPVGAGDREHAVGKLDIAGRGLEQMGGDQLGLGDDLVGGAVERRAADRDRARAEGAGALRYFAGVALHDLDALDRHAEPRRR